MSTDHQCTNEADSNMEKKLKSELLDESRHENQALREEMERNEEKKSTAAAVASTVLPLLTLDRLWADINELVELSGRKQLERLLQCRVPVFLSPFSNCTDCSEENLLADCCFTLIAIDVNAAVKISEKDGVFAGTFLFSVGNGKFFEIVNYADLEKFGSESGEFGCQASYMGTNKRGVPPKGFLFDFVELRGKDVNCFAIRSHFNGKWLRRDDDMYCLLRADCASVETATKFELAPISAGKGYTTDEDDDDDKKMLHGPSSSAVASGYADGKENVEKSAAEQTDKEDEEMSPKNKKKKIETEEK